MSKAESKSGFEYYIPMRFDRYEMWYDSPKSGGCLSDRISGQILELPSGVFYSRWEGSFSDRHSPPKATVDEVKLIHFMNAVGAKQASETDKGAVDIVNQGHGHGGPFLIAHVVVSEKHTDNLTEYALRGSADNQEKYKKFPVLRDNSKVLRIIGIRATTYSESYKAGWYDPKRQNVYFNLFWTHRYGAGKVEEVGEVILPENNDSKKTRRITWHPADKKGSCVTIAEALVEETLWDKISGLEEKLDLVGSDLGMEPSDYAGGSVSAIARLDQLHRIERALPRLRKNQEVLNKKRGELGLTPFSDDPWGEWSKGKTLLLRAVINQANALYKQCGVLDWRLKYFSACESFGRRLEDKERPYLGGMQGRAKMLQELEGFTEDLKDHTTAGKQAWTELIDDSKRKIHKIAAPKGGWEVGRAIGFTGLGLVAVGAFAAWNAFVTNPLAAGLGIALFAIAFLALGIASAVMVHNVRYGLASQVTASDAPFKKVEADGSTVSNKQPEVM